MSDANFEQLWKRIQLYAPDCPTPLAQEFVNTAYSRAINFYEWSQLKGQTEVYFPAIKNDGTISCVNGNNQITGSGTLWTADDQYKQIMVGSLTPYYTVTAVDVPGQILTLDRPFEEVTISGTTYILGQFYMEMPADFFAFDTVIDVFNNWKLHTNFQQRQVDVWDAKRAVAGTPWIVVNAPNRLDANNTVIRRYEWWPKIAPGPKSYPIRYTKRPPLMSNPTDRPIWPLRGDVIRKGALAELCLWPGTSTVKNPYYNINQHQLMEDEFQKGLHGCWRDDQSTSQTAILYEDWEGVPYAPIDARYLQTHDIF